MRLIPVEWYRSEGGLSEGYQQVGMFFSFASLFNKEGVGRIIRQCHKMTKCRDFLHDAARSSITGGHCSIYSFEYNSKTDPPIDFNKMRMLVQAQKIDGITKTVEQFNDIIRCSIKILNHYENIIGIQNSRTYKLEEKDINNKSKKNVILFVGSKFWVKSPFLISLYTLLIRLGDKQLKFENDEDLKKEYDRVIAEFRKNGKGDNDLRYMEVCKNIVNDLLLNAKQILFEGGEEDSRLKNTSIPISSYHDRGGIFSLCSCTTYDEKLNGVIKDLIDSKKGAVKKTQNLEEKTGQGAVIMTQTESVIQKTEKKKLVVVKAYDSYKYTSFQTGFSLVSSPADGRRQCFSFVNCRDYISDAIRSHVLNQGGLSPHYKPGMDPPIDTTKMRLLIVRNFKSRDSELPKYKERLFSGKRAINMYEQIAGWSMSKITTVNYSSTKKERLDAWLLTGPPEWLKYTNLLSMVTLILRIAAERVNGPLEFTDEESLQNLWKELVKKQNSTNYSYVGEDISSYLRECYRLFPILMRRYKEIFSQDYEDAYQNKKGTYHEIGGIYSLCTSKTLNPHLDRIIAKIRKEENLI